jgi:hypothetical protein
LNFKFLKLKNLGAQKNLKDREFGETNFQEKDGHVVYTFSRLGNSNYKFVRYLCLRQFFLSVNLLVVKLSVQSDILQVQSHTCLLKVIRQAGSYKWSLISIFLEFY